MKKTKWNDGWTVTDYPAVPRMAQSDDERRAGRAITLPHDAMIHERKTQSTKNAQQTGFYPGKLYSYRKIFHVPEEWREKTVLLEFEGVYPSARVYLNGDYAGGHPNGYTAFTIKADDFLRYGGDNIIKIMANNSAELNSRWYSGSGIYRNVNILTGDFLHVPMDSIRVTTPEVDALTAVAAVDITLENLSRGQRRPIIRTQILDAAGEVVAEDAFPATLLGGSTASYHRRLPVDAPRLWSCESPHLYTCRVQLLEGDAVTDEETVRFGIRTLALDPRNGLRINGRTVKLRGACIHHDNGIIGACTLERAEERRCQQLKAAGFNCIRSAHNPLSKAMLDACDREGMLVLDELSDIWTRPKNRNDYAQFFPDCWETDVERMVEKDYNHPCVIMYITGNEIPEVGTPQGAELNRRIAGKFRSLDSTRYITSAISAPKEHLSDTAGLGEAQGLPDLSPEDDDCAGSDNLNELLGMMLGPAADAMAASPHLTAIIDEFAAPVDVAGYNYLTGRHILDHELDPNRVVLGTETFPSDIVRLWKIVRENSHVLGDMTWTGYDYLGEAGMGVFYYDGRHGFSPNWPCTAAYTGDLDITGFRRPVSYLRQIVYGLRSDPFIAVERLNHYGERPSTTPWMWRDVVASWTWSGFEGKPAVVHVYADAEEVELFRNGQSLGRRPAGEKVGYMVVYETVYEPGELLAMGYRDGIQTGSFRLVSAGDNVELETQADRTEITADGADLCYIAVQLTDKEGNPNMQAQREITVRVEGAGTLQGFGSAEPETDKGYDCTAWNTYDGRVLAAVRSGREAGEIRVTFSATGCTQKTVRLRAVKNSAETE